MQNEKWKLKTLLCWWNRSGAHDTINLKYSAYQTRKIKIYPTNYFVLTLQQNPTKRAFVIVEK